MKIDPRAHKDSYWNRTLTPELEQDSGDSLSGVVTLMPSIIPKKRGSMSGRRKNVPFSKI